MSKHMSKRGNSILPWEQLKPTPLYRLYIGIADGHVHCAGMGVPVLKMSASGGVGVPALKMTASLRGGHLECRRAHTRATDMPSAMPR